MTHHHHHPRALEGHHPGQRGTLNLSETSLQVPLHTLRPSSKVDGLMPDSSYELTVDLANLAGEWEERRGLRLLPQATLPAPTGATGGVPALPAGLLGAGAVTLLLLLALLLAIWRHTKAVPVTEDMGCQGTRGGMEALYGGREAMETLYSGRKAVEPVYEEVRPVSSLATVGLLASRESLDEEGFLKTNLPRNSLRK